MKRVAGCCLLLAVALRANGDIVLSFPQTLDRAMKVRSVTSTFEEHASTLEALPFRTLPVVRAETAVTSAENLNLLTENVGRVDAFTAIVTADYPLLSGGAEERRVRAMKADAQIVRRRAIDEAEDVFRQTLDAFAQLYTADRRITLVRDGAARAAKLRDRARLMLEAGAISNMTAANWQDQALATESMLLDLELQRLESETRLRQLIGDRSSETLRVELVLDEDPAPMKQISFEQLITADTAVAAATLQEDRRRLALEESLAARRPQLLLSAFGGVANVPSSFRSDSAEGTFGIYGMRLSLSLPMFDPASARRLAEARLELEDAARVKALTANATRNRLDLIWLGLAAAEKRIALLKQAVEVAKRRQDSVTRLVTAGVRSETELVEAANDVARREADLLAVRVDRWKLQQTVQRMAEDRSRMLLAFGGRLPGYQVARLPGGPRVATNQSASAAPPVPTDPALSTRTEQQSTVEQPEAVTQHPVPQPETSPQPTPTAPWQPGNPATGQPTQQPSNPATEQPTPQPTPTAPWQPGNPATGQPTQQPSNPATEQPQSATGQPKSPIP